MFSVTVTQEVRLSFKDVDLHDSAKADLEASILSRVSDEYPDLLFSKDPTYWFNFSIKYRTINGPGVHINRLEAAYNTLKRFSENEGLVEGF